MKPVEILKRAFMAAPYPGSRKKPSVSRTLAAEFLMLVLERAVKAGGFIREERITWIDYDFGHFRGEDLVKRLGWKMSYILGGSRRGDYDLATEEPEVYRFVRDFLDAHRKELAEIELTRKEKDLLTTRPMKANPLTVVGIR